MTLIYSDVFILPGNRNCDNSLSALRTVSTDCFSLCLSGCNSNMVLVLDPLQEKVSCPLTARSQLDSPSSDVIPRYCTHSNSSGHASHNCSRACASEQMDETPGGSSLTPAAEPDAQEKIAEPCCSSVSNGEDALDGAAISIQRRRAVKKPSEDSVLKQKVTNLGNCVHWCQGGSTRRCYSAAGPTRLHFTALSSDVTRMLCPGFHNEPCLGNCHKH